MSCGIKSANSFLSALPDTVSQAANPGTERLKLVQKTIEDRRIVLETILLRDIAPASFARPYQLHSILRSQSNFGTGVDFLQDFRNASAIAVSFIRTLKEYNITKQDLESWRETMRNVIPMVQSAIGGQISIFRQCPVVLDQAAVQVMHEFAKFMPELFDTGFTTAVEVYGAISIEQVYQLQHGMDHLVLIVAYFLETVCQS